MKTSFHIPPSEPNAAENHLLLEIRDTGFCLMWYQPQPLVVTGYSVYLLEPFETSITGLKELIAQFQLTAFPKNNIQIFYNTRRCAYLPSTFSEKTASFQSLLQLMQGEAPSEVVFASTFQNAAITQIFSIPEDVKKLADTISSLHSPNHVNACIEPHLQGSDLLYCHVFYDNISVMLRKNDQWQIFQQFPYQTPEDISYHLIHICNQHKMKVADTPLLLSGMIIQESNLYQQLYNFFLHINFMPLPANANVEDHLNELPTHFITPLTYLASCVS